MLSADFEGRSVLLCGTFLCQSFLNVVSSYITTHMFWGKNIFFVDKAIGQMFSGTKMPIIDNIKYTV